MRRGAADGSDDDDNTDDEEEEPTEIEEDDLQEHETWIEWLRRRTRLTEHVLESLRLDDWVQAQRRRKWKYCGHILRRDDNRWATALITWRPDSGFRSKGRPRKRWTQAFYHLFQKTFDADAGTWILLAMERDEWRTLENEFEYCNEE